jgi:hypothetical protein
LRAAAAPPQLENNKLSVPSARASLPRLVILKFWDRKPAERPDAGFVYLVVAVNFVEMWQIDLTPEIFKSRRTQFGIPFVAEVGLQSASVMAPVREGIAAGMAQHVRVDACELGRFSSSRDHLAEASRGKRRSTLGREHKRRRRCGAGTHSAPT